MPEPMTLPDAAARLGLITESRGRDGLGPIYALMDKEGHQVAEGSAPFCRGVLLGYEGGLGRRMTEEIAKEWADSEG